LPGRLGRSAVCVLLRRSPVAPGLLATVPLLRPLLRTLLRPRVSTTLLRPRVSTRTGLTALARRSAKASLLARWRLAEVLPLLALLIRRLAIVLLSLLALLRVLLPSELRRSGLGVASRLWGCCVIP